MLHIIIMCYPICFALLIHSIPANLSIRKTVAWWSNQNKNKNNSSLTQKLTFMVHFMTQRKSVFYVFFLLCFPWAPAHTNDITVSIEINVRQRRASHTSEYVIVTKATGSEGMKTKANQIRQMEEHRYIHRLTWI